jgi:hypothetical protein
MHGSRHICAERRNGSPSACRAGLDEARRAWLLEDCEEDLAALVDDAENRGIGERGARESARRDPDAVKVIPLSSIGLSLSP